MKTLLSILFFISLLSDRVFSQSFIVLNDKKESYTIGKNLEFYEDKKHQENIDSIIDVKNFQTSVKDILSFGYSSSIYWVKFYINNESKESEYLLEYAYPNMDKIEFFIPEENGQYIQKISGDIFPFSQRDIEYRNVIFRLKNINSKSPYYMKLTSEGSMQIDLRILTHKAFSEKLNTEQLIYGLYYGIILVMILYNTILFLSIKDITYIPHSPRSRKKNI